MTPNQAPISDGIGRSFTVQRRMLFDPATSHLLGLPRLWDPAWENTGQPQPSWEAYLESGDGVPLTPLAT